MLNYAESLSYWYLRLNGFFPITNFVLHQPKGMGQSSDCDVLGIRLPATRETIANSLDNTVSCDENLFNGIEVDLRKDTVGVIVQVKSGGFTMEDISNSFCEENLFYACNRLGLFDNQDVSNIAEELSNTIQFRQENRVVIKMLVTASGHSKPAYDKALNITLEEIVKFITNRFNLYSKHKSSSRMYFSDPLIQYIAWRSKKDKGTTGKQAFSMDD